MQQTLKLAYDSCLHYLALIAGRWGFEKFTNPACQLKVGHKRFTIVLVHPTAVAYHSEHQFHSG